MSYGQAGSLVKDSRPTHGSPSPNTKWQPRAMSKACINPFKTKTCYASYGLTASACRSQAGLQGCGVGISWGGGRRLWIRRTSILHTFGDGGELASSAVPTHCRQTRHQTRQFPKKMLPYTGKAPRKATEPYPLPQASAGPVENGSMPRPWQPT